MNITRQTDIIKNKYFDIVNKNWNNSDISSSDKWMDLFSDVCNTIQQEFQGKLLGNEKADMATNILSGVAGLVKDKNSNLLSGKQRETLDMFSSNQGKVLLKASTGIIKQLINFVDINGDGQISAAECKASFCCCCPTLNASAPRSSGSGF